MTTTNPTEPAFEPAFERYCIHKADLQRVIETLDPTQVKTLLGFLYPILNRLVWTTVDAQGTLTPLKKCV